MHAHTAAHFFLMLGPWSDGSAAEYELIHAADTQFLKDISLGIPSISGSILFADKGGEKTTSYSCRTLIKEAYDSTDGSWYINSDSTTGGGAASD